MWLMIETCKCIHFDKEYITKMNCFPSRVNTLKRIKSGDGVSYYFILFNIVQGQKKIS